MSYVGLRADEDRDGYLSGKPNITPRYPFRVDGVTREDVFRILDESGVGLPSYYSWRSRSGCYFCFFQRKAEWLGLLEHHPDLFERAKAYEKLDPKTGARFTWQQGETLEELAAPARRAATLAAPDRRPARPATLAEVLAGPDDPEDGGPGCLICDL